jgi:hypothetical protein
MERALASLALPESAIPRIVRIVNTLSLDKFQASEAYVNEVRSREDLVVVNSPRSMEFDAFGNLTQ